MQNKVGRFSSPPAQVASSKLVKKPKPPYYSRRETFNSVIVIDTGNRGRGVFATTDFVGGQAIGEVRGEYKPRDYRSDYCVDFKDGTLEPVAPYRFLNHSCDPNCQFIEWQIETPDNETVSELWLHALRAISTGEELTIDSGWDWQAAIPCLCGAPNCRGWICKEEDLESLRQFRPNEYTRVLETRTTVNS